MDFTLRCNSLKCRAQLNDRAVVTTCCHVFCVDCSNQLGLTHPNGARICPACQSSLPNPDDAVMTILNPTEDYKTSVLSGLTPSVIMECAGRALSFYSYQATQEIVYQEHLYASTHERVNKLNTAMDKLVQDANSEIVSLRDKLHMVQGAYKSLEEKNHELQDRYLQKSRAHVQTQKLYHNLKAQVMTSQVRNAASDNAAEAINTGTGPYFTDRTDSSGTGRAFKAQTGRNEFPMEGIRGNAHARQGSESSGGSPQFAGIRPRHKQFGNVWDSGRGMSGSQGSGAGGAPTFGTPSHRQQLPLSGGGHNYASGPAFGGGAGYGLSGGMKIGKQSGAGAGHSHKVGNSSMPMR